MICIACAKISVFLKNNNFVLLDYDEGAYDNFFFLMDNASNIDY